MKIKLLVFAMFLIGHLSFSQNTNVPDDNFENYLETHDAAGNTVPLGDVLSMGNGIANDDTVTTANINTVTTLGVTGLGISDLTGIADFVSLTELQCSDNQLTSLDVSNNIALTYLSCGINQLTSLDVSNNTLLEIFHCNSNNQLESLNVKNCNNLYDLVALNNPKLFCIDVSDVTFAETWWHNIDSQCSFSEDCATFLGVDDEILTEGLKLYPNPVSDILFVESKIALKKIEIYSILGQKVKEINSDFNSISTNHLSRGIFLIKIYSEKGIVVRKLIKQ